MRLTSAASALHATKTKPGEFKSNVEATYVIGGFLSLPFFGLRH